MRKSCNLSTKSHKKSLKLVSALTLALCCGFGTAFAEEIPVKEPQQQERGHQQSSTVQSSDDFTLEGITVEAKRPDWEAKLSPGTVTIIRPDDYKGEQKSLADMLKDVPGVHVREVNGKGHYTTVSVRGSTAAQVGVFVDGVLSNLGGDAAADISTIPVKNVERIEVYRGYIPARFGGTYMGGVINIVTKRPTKANITANVGKSSFGGFQGSLQVDAPLGKGSLMVGVNTEQSDGDFGYKNYVAADYGYNLELSRMQDTADGFKMLFIDYGFWDLYGFGSEYDYIKDALSQNALVGMDLVAEAYFNDPDFYAILGPGFSMPGDYLKAKETAERYKGGNYHRLNNNYKNTDIIAKWQDDNWTVKAAFKDINRGMPRDLLSGAMVGAGNIDSSDLLYNYNMEQDLKAEEFLVGRRNQSGNLEWGFSLNYLKQDKSYRSHNPIDDVNYKYVPFREWSKYSSERVGGMIDGSYKAGDKHLLEFLINYSDEKMHVDGSNLHGGNLESDKITPKPVSIYRTLYKQQLLNIQLQDTVTLDKKGSLWLTPSLRYNSSTTYGIAPYDAQRVWNNEVEETFSKTTWQLALKKEFSDSFSLRATGGSYYRLLNLYEIAGDGAGILPMPTVGSGGIKSAFPLPEEGKQWDLSAIWNRKPKFPKNNLHKATKNPINT